MLRPKLPIVAPVEPKNYPFGEKIAPFASPHTLAVVALSHTPVQHRIYSAMLSAQADDSKSTTFTARLLMTITGIRSLSTVRRGLDGLEVSKPRSSICGVSTPSLE